MNEEYDPRQWAEMARCDFGGVEMWTRKSRQYPTSVAIKIYAVTSLTWQDVQRLGICGKDRYNKLVTLYNTLLEQVEDIKELEL